MASKLPTEKTEVLDVAATVAKGQEAQRKAVAAEKRHAVRQEGAERQAKILVPHPYPSRAIPGKVLQEEDYTEAVSAIIERDFFPDLPLLRARHELLCARNAGNDQLALALEKRLAEMPRPTPASTQTQTPQPAPFEAAPSETPEAASDAGNLGELGHRFPPTPPPMVSGRSASSAAARRLSQWEREDDAQSVATGAEESLGAQQTLLRLASGRDVAVDLANVRLDEFQQVFTSEDNASFEAVLDKDKEKRRQKEWWVEDAELKQNTKCLQHDIALESGDCGETVHGDIATNKFKARNTLCFKPRGELSIPIAKPLVEFKNTRFTTKQQVVIESDLATAVAARHARAAGEKVQEVLSKMVKDGIFPVAALHNHGQEMRAVGGRLIAPQNGSAPSGSSLPLVNTPTMLPGEDGMSPLMTFGKIASTPRLIDEESLGPKFTMQQESARDRAADKLARGAMQNKRESRQNSKRERLRAMGLSPDTPLPGKTPTGSSSRTTPAFSVASKLSPMSPIGQLLHRAQRLAQKGGRLRIGTGGGGNSVTPGSSQEPAAKRARKLPAGAPGSDLPASMMDDLL